MVNPIPCLKSGLRLSQLSMCYNEEAVVMGELFE